MQFLAFSPIAQADPAGNPLFSLLMPMLFFALAMWFLFIAPQQKQKKEKEKMINALGSGDKIVTIGGFYGIVQSVKEDRVVVKIAEGTKVEIEKSAVQTVANKDSGKK
tara:strand:+ start:127 stop:450 length:324 start_codon:yes stop_codon:yes gene_type:complete